MRNTPARPREGMPESPHSSLETAGLRLRLSSRTPRNAVGDRIHLQESDGCMTEREIQPRGRPQCIR